MNVNLPLIYAQCFGIDKTDKRFDCIVHGARSRAGKVMTFHVHLESGAHYSLLPLHKLVWKQDVPDWSLPDLQPWDCFSDHCQAIVFEYLREKRTYLIGKKVWGHYILTFDWYDNAFSDYPPEFKQGHLIKLDNGLFGIYPNNYLLFQDKSYTGQLDLGSVPKLFRQMPDDYPSVENL